MTIVREKPLEFDVQSWDGGNTEMIKEWAEPFLPALPKGRTRVWDVIPDFSDPDNPVPGGVLRARVSDSGASYYTTNFPRGHMAVAGPIYDGQPSPFGGAGIQVMPEEQYAERYDPV